MATLTATTLSRSGVSIEDNDVAAAAGGDQFANTGQEYVIIKNAGSEITATFATGMTVDSLAVANKDVTCGASETTVVGPFPPGWYNDANGYVQITYSSVTSVTILVVKLPAA